MKKVALIGEIHEDGIEFLKKSNYSLINISDVSSNNLIDKLKDVDAIAIRTATLNEDILKECKSLKIVARHGVGYDSVDLDYLNKNKIALAITGSANAVTVAEHVLSMFLNLCKITNISDHIVRSGKFEEKKSSNNMIELFQKNIFIIGFGRIGKALAKRCNAFETNVYVYDPYIEEKIIKENKCFPISFEQGIELADFITVHLPLNEKTRYLITKTELSKMKKTCILVNTARGGIINEEDLCWALKNNIIRSAGLDVFEKEPPENNNPLFKIDNIILSPHNAALTLECKQRMGFETCQNIVNYLNKSPDLVLTNIVNREILDLN